MLKQNGHTKKGIVACRDGKRSDSKAGRKKVVKRKGMEFQNPAFKNVRVARIIFTAYITSTHPTAQTAGCTLDISAVSSQSASLHKVCRRLSVLSASLPTLREKKNALCIHLVIITDLKFNPQVEQRSNDFIHAISLILKWKKDKTNP